jgi:hypothetical protein
MKRTGTGNTNMNLHAAAIARWDDEGGASRVAEQEQIPKDQGQQRPRRMEISRRSPDASHRTYRR